MTIDEAIRDLQARVKGEFYIKPVDDCADMKLGIEALKDKKYRRITMYPFNQYLLPGETEEKV